MKQFIYPDYNFRCWINSNMGCIETTNFQVGVCGVKGLIVIWDVLKPLVERVRKFYQKINSNMGCIETLKRDNNFCYHDMINSNMGCIETQAEHLILHM